MSINTSSNIFSIANAGLTPSESIAEVANQTALKTILQGTIKDENGNPIQGVNITITQTPSVDAEALGTIKPIATNLTSNKEGQWQKIYPTTDINLPDINITFIKPGYQLKNISNPQITKKFPSSVPQVKKVSTRETEPPYVYNVGNEEFSSEKDDIAKAKADNFYNIARENEGATLVSIPQITLSPISNAIEPLVQPIVDQINELEQSQAQETNKQDLPPSVRLTVNVNIQKEELKRKLIPFIIKLLLPFGLVAVQAILSRIDLEKIKDQISCPRQDEILKIINKRNKLVRQINGIYKTITTISKVLVGLNIAISALQVGILAVTVIPIPLPPVIPIGAEELKEELKKFQIAINIVTLTLAAFGVVLGIILRLLDALDFLIRECAQNQNIPFETINNELNILVNQSTGISNSAVIANDNTYKGFKLELQLDEANQSKYPRRFAQALNKQGVPVLKTESSFASDPQVLLDQLKFIIDSNPQLTAE
jgi:hypothetical protein